MKKSEAFRRSFAELERTPPPRSEDCVALSAYLLKCASAFETAWEAMWEAMTELEIDLRFEEPLPVLRTAFQQGLIQSVVPWRELYDLQNLTARHFDAGMTEEFLQSLPSMLRAFEDLDGKLSAWEDERFACGGGR